MRSEVLVLEVKILRIVILMNLITDTYIFLKLKKLSKKK